MRLTTRARFRAAALLIALAAALPATASAQKPRKEPKRPKLEAGQDTNSAIAYYQFGISKLPKRPRDAADAFYWASRLAPQWAEPYYARRISIILSERSGHMWPYLTRRRAVVESDWGRMVDSLQYRALVRNPFLVQNLDRMLIDEIVYQMSGGEAMPVYGMRSGDPEYDAWMAYTGGQYAKAVRYYGDAIKRQPKEPLHHAQRARAFYALQEYDSAVTELTTLLGKLQKEEKDRLFYFFDSKSMYQYSLGTLHSIRGDAAAAREAFGHALTEDLSFYMAHAALGDLAMQAGDTTTALGEYRLAVEINGEDPALRFGYALALVQANRAADAVREFEAAIEKEPLFAMPYYYLGRLHDAFEMHDDAKQYYTDFVARAAQVMEERQWVEQRLAALKGSER
jgi:tetratricopeptide (TPR) repeat protein